MVSEIGFLDALSLAQTIGIVGTMVLTLYFSKRQVQALSSEETRVLNDLDEISDCTLVEPFILLTFEFGAK